MPPDFLLQKWFARVVKRRGQVARDWINETLQPGGFTLISVTSPNHADTPLLVHLLEWLMHERSREDFEQIIAGSRFAECSIEWSVDESQIFQYCLLRKPD